jgi:WD40 repeat protein
VKVIDNRDSSQLVSISNDGKLCTWSLENLNLPVDTTELYIASTNRNVYATCFDFQTIVNDNIEAELNNSNNNVSRQINESYSYVYKANLQMFKQFAIVGAEDGLVHSVSKNTSKFSLFETFNSHESFNGPVTAVSCYNQCKPEYNEYSYQTNEYLSQLFLTSSFDGSIKLWNSTVNILNLKKRKWLFFGLNGKIGVTWVRAKINCFFFQNKSFFFLFFSFTEFRCMLYVQYFFNFLIGA